ncbi:MAG: hypothetical protein Q4G59_07960, partial [Planctomycetia bacterium]|nr:hypothetical protein [Planctomycetia bacterium]
QMQDADETSALPGSRPSGYTGSTRSSLGITNVKSEEAFGRDDQMQDADETSALPACFQVKNDLLGIEWFLALREHHYPFSKLHPKKPHKDFYS